MAAAIFAFIWGGALMIFGVVLTIAWLGFIFGSVVGVILILLFQPGLFLLPFGLSIYGFAIFAGGFELLEKARAVSHTDD